MVIENGVQILGQSLQDLIRIYVSYLTFGIDIAAGIIIGISSFGITVLFRGSILGSWALAYR